MGPFKLSKRRRKTLVRFFRPASRRDALIASLAHWNRNQALRITAAVLLAWLIGAGGIYLAERGVNPAFGTFGATVPRAHSVVVLADDRQGEHADGKTILICIALRNICRGEHQPNISVECRNPNYIYHLRKAGADEIISSDELGLRLLARSALYH